MRTQRQAQEKLKSNMQMQKQKEIEQSMKDKERLLRAKNYAEEQRRLNQKTKKDDK